MLEPDCLVGLALVHELGSEHAPRSHRLAGVVIHFVDDGEAVAAAQILVEVDVGRKDVGDLARHGVGEPGGVGCREERGLDFGGAHHDAPLERRDLFGYAVALALGLTVSTMRPVE